MTATGASTPETSSATEPAGAPRTFVARLRVPLHLKVMVSYLLVVGLVLFPTLIYLRTLFRESLIEITERRLDTELAALAVRLGRAPEDEIPQLAALMVDALPQRVTIVDASGRVIADSNGDLRSDNHATRPEVMTALGTGFGQSVRTSTRTRDERIYVARPFPAAPPHRGVVRLSVPTRSLDDAVARSYRFTEKAGALALSAAVVLSLVAALVVSRPLRRLTDSVRAFGQGDLGHAVGVDSSDELGELADALRELSRALSARLREAGSYKATLETLFDELPLGVIVYDDAGQPQYVSSRARELCHYPLSEDLERAMALVNDPSSVRAIAAARAGDTSVVTDVPGKVLGKKAGNVEARWVAVPGHPRDGRIVCLLSDDASADRIAVLEEVVRTSGSILREAAGGTREVALAARLESAADDAERAVLTRRATPDQVETREVGPLCAAAIDELRARAAARGIRINIEFDDPTLRVVEAQGRAQQAIRRLVDAMIAETPADAEVRLESTAGPKQVRITARALDARRIKTKPIGEIIHCLGGDAGSKHTGDASEAWIKIPRG